MSLTLKSPQKKNNAPLVDRPAWIPDYITEDWDTDPNAYQTEGESMPAGGTHSLVLGYILSLLIPLAKSKGLMLLHDIFMLYRDEYERGQRIAPDLLLMPSEGSAPSAYDLETRSPPLMVAEVTSPSSLTADLYDKSALYMELGIPTYLVIDVVLPNSKPREEIDLYLWQLIDGQRQRIQPDSDGYLILPDLDVGIRAEGQQLIFKNMQTDEIIKDSGEYQQELEEERRAKEEERKARLEVEDENARLKAELERLRKEQNK